MQKIYWGKESVLVLGDSHAGVFNDWRFRVLFPRTRFQKCIVGGATVSGLQNPNSKTQAMTHFKNALRKSAPTVIITLLGEVDTGFVIWHRSEKWSQSVEDMLKVALDNYQKLLLESASIAKVVAISAPLPTIRDGQQWGEVANLRKGVVATQRMRTDLTLKFNQAVEGIVRQMRQTYLSLDDQSLGNDGLVAEWLLDQDPKDHHYANSVYAGLLAPMLASAFKRIRTPDLNAVQASRCWHK